MEQDCVIQFTAKSNVNRRVAYKIKKITVIITKNSQQHVKTSQFYFEVTTVMKNVLSRHDIMPGPSIAMI